MFKFSKPVIVQEEEKSHKEQQREIGPQKKSVVSLQTQDTAQATDAGQNKEPDNTVLIIVIVVVCVVIGLGVYFGFKNKKKGMTGGGTVPNTVAAVSNTVAAVSNTVAASVPSIIDEEVSSILTNLSQL